MTHHLAPLLDVIESIYTNVEPPQEDENLNPKQKAGLKELIYCLVCFLSSVVATGNLCKVFCPETACIFQGTPDMDSPLCWKILDLTEDNMVIQVADIPLQPLLHHIET